MGHISERVASRPTRERLLHRNVQRFRGGLVFKAHRRVSLTSRLESKRERLENGNETVGRGAHHPARAAEEHRVAVAAHVPAVLRIAFEWRVQWTDTHSIAKSCFSQKTAFVVGGKSG